jgi:predicted Rossmann fold flavoprotein
MEPASLKRFGYKWLAIGAKTVPHRDAVQTIPNEKEHALSETRIEWDVAVLGAGAAGLCAAIRAAERGRSVVLLEKNRRPGVKILISGGTRCNITNARGLRTLHVVSGSIDQAYDSCQARGPRSIQEAFRSGGWFLAPALKSMTVEATIEMFEAEGVATKVEANGKVFPASDKATDVLAALVSRLERSRAALRTNSPALRVDAFPDRFQISSPNALLTAGRVIVAAGGQSYPGCGTTGDGYAIARSFGHTVVDARPALVPIRVAAAWVRELSGISLADVNAAIVDAAGSTLLARREAVLFAHFGLSGPAILDISRAVARHENPDQLRVVLDLLPEYRADALETHVQSACRSGRLAVAGVLPPQIPRRLVDAILQASGIPLDRKGPELGRDERRRLVSNVKHLELPVAGTLGFAKAEVTSGGVALDEINPQTLESRRQPGLHFCGEVLDLDGLIGGYNFQAAWSTGWLAGESV